MVVQTTTALASGQFSEKMGSLEAEKTRLNESLNRTTYDYSRLLELSENLTEQLEEKSLSFIQLEKDYNVSYWRENTETNSKDVYIFRVAQIKRYTIYNFIFLTAP